MERWTIRKNNIAKNDSMSLPSGEYLVIKRSDGKGRFTTATVLDRDNLEAYELSFQGFLSHYFNLRNVLRIDGDGGFKVIETNAIVIEK